MKKLSNEELDILIYTRDSFMPGNELMRKNRNPESWYISQGICQVIALRFYELNDGYFTPCEIDSLYPEMKKEIDELICKRYGNNNGIFAWDTSDTKSRVDFLNKWIDKYSKKMNKPTKIIKP
jgi:hypothetical protein